MIYDFGSQNLWSKGFDLVSLTERRDEQYI